MNYILESIGALLLILTWCTATLFSSSFPSLLWLVAPVLCNLVSKVTSVPLQLRCWQLEHSPSLFFSCIQVIFFPQIYASELIMTHPVSLCQSSTSSHAFSFFYFSLCHALCTRLISLFHVLSAPFLHLFTIECSCNTFSVYIINKTLKVIKLTYVAEGVFFRFRFYLSTCSPCLLLSFVLPDTIYELQERFVLLFSCFSLALIKLWI